MGLFKTKQVQVVARPKSDYVPVVQTVLDEVNSLQREIYVRLRGGDRPGSVSMLVLDNRQSELLRQLVHDFAVMPVIDRKSGYWYLYEAR